jgi:hypothetical protein
MYYRVVKYMLTDVSEVRNASTNRAMIYLTTRQYIPEDSELILTAMRTWSLTQLTFCCRKLWDSCTLHLIMQHKKVPVVSAVLDTIRPRRATLLMSTGWDCVSELRQPTGLLFIPEVKGYKSVSMESEWNDIARVKPKNSEDNLSQCHSVHYKSHMNCPTRYPGPPRWQDGD